ncbi:hypothetical protein F7725_020923 [Dissostichus mawsoni]|uniref:Uncharacterized protein n=1 Tax=Dissostichus mawsoni TaxID=36200 RepID=A0A7J5YEN6_DISMA|nr:hypothetical protein F7725_020923 [Dissostichus mawsoni]
MEVASSITEGGPVTVCYLVRPGVTPPPWLGSWEELFWAARRAACLSISRLLSLSGTKNWMSYLYLPVHFLFVLPKFPPPPLQICCLKETETITPLDSSWRRSMSRLLCASSLSRSAPRSSSRVMRNSFSMAALSSLGAGKHQCSFPLSFSPPPPPPPPLLSSAPPEGEAFSSPSPPHLYLGSSSLGLFWILKKASSSSSWVLGVRDIRPLEVSGLCMTKEVPRLSVFGWSPTPCPEREEFEREGEGLDWWRTSRSTLDAEGLSLLKSCKILKRKKRRASSSLTWFLLPLSEDRWRWRPLRDSFVEGKRMNSPSVPDRGTKEGVQRHKGEKGWRRAHFLILIVIIIFIIIKARQSERHSLLLPVAQHTRGSTAPKALTEKDKEFTNRVKCNGLGVVIMYTWDLTPSDVFSGSSPPELPRVRRRAGAEPDRGAGPGASRPLRGARLPRGDGRRPREELSASGRARAPGPPGGGSARRRGGPTWTDQLVSDESSCSHGYCRGIHNRKESRRGED